MTTTDPRSPSSDGFVQHPYRGAFNAAFFAAAGPSLERSMRSQKQRAFADLPREVVEIGSGVGANLSFVPTGGLLVALEPNRAMHHRLREAGRRLGVRIELLERTAERTGLESASVDCVISSLVLCSVRDPAMVLAEVRRILRPGGTFRFAEHVAADAGSPTRIAQRLLRRPWAWTFEGCSCERDLEAAIRSAGFSRVELDRYRIASPFLNFNTHIAGIATA